MSDVTVYTSENCSKCASLKNLLTNKNIPFKTASIDNTDVMAELVMRNIVVMSAPALQIDEKVYVETDIFNDDNTLKLDLNKVITVKTGLFKHTISMLEPVRGHSELCDKNNVYALINRVNNELSSIINDKGDVLDDLIKCFIKWFGE